MTVGASTTLTNMFNGAAAMAATYTGTGGFGITPTARFFNQTITNCVVADTVYDTIARDIGYPITLANIKAWETGDDITQCDVSSLTDLSFAFNGKTDFNQDISDWDTSSVTDMRAMFQERQQLQPRHRHTGTRVQSLAWLGMFCIA